MNEQRKLAWFQCADHAYVITCTTENGFDWNYNVWRTNVWFEYPHLIAQTNTYANAIRRVASDDDMVDD